MGEEASFIVSGSSQETGNPAVVLEMLSQVERDSATSQRKLAGELNIALGLANAYLRRCVRKGLIKMSQAPLGRYAYYLTPQGFVEKSRLTAEYLNVSLNFFRRARTDCATLCHECAERGWRKVALYGAGDLAEIAVLSAGETPIEVVCIIDPAAAGSRCAGLPVVVALAEAQQRAETGGLDGVIVTDTRAPQTCFDRLIASVAEDGLAPNRIVAPKLLGISLSPISERFEVVP